MTDDHAIILRALAEFARLRPDPEPYDIGELIVSAVGALDRMKGEFERGRRAFCDELSGEWYSSPEGFLADFKDQQQTLHDLTGGSAAVMYCDQYLRDTLVRKAKP